MKVTVTTKRCMVCGKTGELGVDAIGYLDWKAGTLIQDALPELSKADRELLMTGTHPECWDTMMKQFEEQT
jgi:hypothetical protein